MAAAAVVAGVVGDLVLAAARRVALDWEEHLLPHSSTAVVASQT